MRFITIEPPFGEYFLFFANHLKQRSSLETNGYFRGIPIGAKNCDCKIYLHLHGGLKIHGIM